MDPYAPVSIRVPLETPSVNAWHGAHYRRYRHHFNRWFMHLRAKLPPRRFPPDHLVKGRIIVYRGRKLDFANLVAGCKPIPDCLKRFGYIRDDSPAWIEFDYAQHLAGPGGVRETVIQLWRPA